MKRTSADDADKIAGALYGTAWLHFERGPITESAWAALEHRFNDAAFAQVFGVPFARDLVVSAASVLSRTGLSGEQLLRIWNEGREPLSASDLTTRYGATAARLLADGQQSLDWFHCSWPIGIQQISPGLVAFALRHPAILDGKPTIVINGHCLALPERFRAPGGRGCVLVAAGAPANGPEVSDIRSWIVGEDNRPGRCAPGSIRRDAATGNLPLAAVRLPVSPWANVLHCSDGYFAGMMESSALLPGESHGLLRAELDRLGYTGDELASILLNDPVVRISGTELRLSERTQGLRLGDCVAMITSLFPPIFGQPNDFAAGVTPSRLMDSARSLRAVSGDAAAFSAVAETRRPTVTVGDRRSVVRATDGSVGLELIASSRVGLLVPAAGTGGRFGGYDLPESDPRRHKALAPVFRAEGREVCALDIRLANARHWSAATGGQVRVAITTSGATRAGVTAWAADNGAAGMDVTLIAQPELYRFNAASLQKPADPLAPIFLEDFVLRSEDGSPNLKSAGTLGLISSFVISGVMDTWIRAGINFIAIANSDDIGFRLDPELVGYMQRRPDIDAVVLAAPAGYRGWIENNGRKIEVRGDRTGWCIDEYGHPVDRHSTADRHPVPDSGGFLGEIQTAQGWRAVVIDGAAVGGDTGDYPFLNTNQMYLRASALTRIFPPGSPEERAHHVGRVRGTLPLYAERKIVKAGAQESQEAIQVFQPLPEILRILEGITPLLTARALVQGRRGAYLPLKTKADISFAQRFLDDAARAGDELAFGEAPSMARSR